MRLNRWQRIGIVLSIVWAVSAAIYQRNADVDKAEGFAKYANRVCLDAKSIAHDPDLSSCELERQENLTNWMSGSWGNVAFLALAPIPLGWLTAIILFYVGRAQVIGFRAVVPWATLTSRQRALVIGCVLFSSVAVLFGILSALNLYVDTKVPVALGVSAMVTQSGEDIVYAEGTWTRDSSKEGSMLDTPLQTSAINCYRQQKQCTEARAFVSGNVLMTELVEYEIESWSATTIVFRRDYPCFIEIFTVDRTTKSVNGVGQPINMKSDLCKHFADNKVRNWNYHLGDGFKVYWEQRQKARPFPLRLIQALFGN